MNKSVQFSMKKLEFHLILEALENFAVNDKTKKLITELSPISDVNDLNLELDRTDEALMITTRIDFAQIYLIRDITDILKRLSIKAILSGAEIYEVHNLLRTVKGNNQLLTILHKENIETKYFEELVDSLFYDENIYQKITSSIDEDGSILDDASSNLRNIRSKLRNIDIRIKNKLQELLGKESAKLSQTTVSMRDDHYVIPVKAEYKNQFPGTIRDVSASNQTVFIEPLIVTQLMNEKRELKYEEKEEEERILRNLSNILSEYVEELSFTFKQIVDLDFLFAKARLAKKQDARRVNINTNHQFNLINARHPLLNVKKVIPNNVDFNKYLGIVITGPNTGGKTVLLKTVGLLSLMVKHGLLIPADEKSNVMIYDMIVCDIGDDQSIIENLSTFSSHMKNIIEIVDNVTPNSLVLFDEIGGGTDPEEGSNLAIGILSYLIKNNISFITTTHYSELKAFAFNEEKIVNASMEFNQDTLSPTYKLKIGTPGASNAFNIASKLGLKDEIVEFAKERQANSQSDVKDLIEKLEIKNRELDEETKKIQEELKTYQELTSKYNQKLSNISQKEEKIIQEAEKKAEIIVEKITQDAKKILSEIKEKQTAEQVKLHETIALKKELDNLIPEKEVIVKTPTRDVHMGDTVYVKSYDQYGEVIKVLKPKQFEVLVGNVKLKLNSGQIELVEGPIKEISKPKQSSFIKHKSVAHMSLTLDLRGERYEEAKDKLEKYFDDCIYTNIKQVTIIHGYGTGTIRTLVHSFLKNNPHVESYRFGGANEGGQGSTIVYFK